MKLFKLFRFRQRASHAVTSEKIDCNQNGHPIPVNTIPTVDNFPIDCSNNMKEELQVINVNHEIAAVPTEERQLIDASLWCKIKCVFVEWSSLLALLLIFFLLWGIGYSVLPEHTHPAGSFMRMAFLFVGAQLSGILITFIKLPDMLGMLFFGVLYTNIGLADFHEIQRLEVFLREMALINIMLLAGLGLDFKPLKELFRIIMQITLLPTIAEVAALSVLSHFLLDMPWMWGILLGLVVTAISPNVVVTVLLKLKEDRLGLNKGIHTVIIAVLSCNDVIAIFLFGVILGVIFSTGNLTSQILQGPIGIIIGLVYGTVTGYALLLLPAVNAKYVNGLKFTLITLIGTLSVVGSKAIKYPSAGALGCITTAFVATEGWKKQRDTYSNNEVAMYLDLLWKFIKPISFSLIGKEVNFLVLDSHTVLYGAITLLVGVIMRLVVSYFSAYGAGFNWKEKAYITISGFPKATVQAALGPLALDMARNTGQNTEYATAVLIISVIAIIFTAPLGAILMLRLAPKWLEKQSRSDLEVN